MNVQVFFSCGWLYLIIRERGLGQFNGENVEREGGGGGMWLPLSHREAVTGFLKVDNA